MIIDWNKPSVDKSLPEEGKWKVIKYGYERYVIIDHRGFEICNGARSAYLHDIVHWRNGKKKGL